MEARNPIGATQTTIQIVEKLVELDGASVAELTAELPVTKGTVHNHLATLRELGYVKKSEGAYYPALRFLSPAFRAREQTPLAMAPSAPIDELVKTTGQRVDLVALEDGRAVLVRTERGEQYDGEQTVVGTPLPLHCSALGKAILATVDHLQVEDVLASADPLVWTERTTTDPDELKQELMKIQAERIARNRSEYRPGIWGIASPVFLSDQVCGAVGVLGRAADMRGKTIQQDVPGLVLSAAEHLSQALDES